jgi:hypothetical protein
MPRRPHHQAAACTDATAHLRRGKRRTTAYTSCSVRSPGRCRPHRPVRHPDITAPSPRSCLPFAPSTRHTSCRHSTHHALGAVKALDRAGRAKARSGLRMMPTFPLPSLKFRTAGFPQYGFKAGRSRQGLPVRRLLASDGLLLSFVLPASLVSSPFCAGGRGALEHLRSSGRCRSTPGALAPDRVVLSRSILTCGPPSAPLAGTSRFHRSAAYTKCLRCAHCA